ncbi:Sec-independent protein translocase subunit TatA/TatB [Nitrolancea hollandica]|uniref:Sec-independent protein translocase protein TatA n=1 Tax=Nitrolancea hollandica Lb TaxID=1129897 RepID=I4EJR7_9BACT|nr:twin-arginine translocase TatA/TatE family subunit [Nitrolancea hollandica]CCF84929.1 Twin-arginine translocation protein, TatA/E family subunit [Nitrolancea hollandica Lb]
MFGVGPMEMLVIAVIALLVFGPERLPEIAGKIGRGVREFRAATGELTTEFQRAMVEAQSTIDDVKQPAIEVRQTAESALSTVRLDQVEPPSATDPTPDTPATVARHPNGSNGAKRFPTKDDPLADLGGFDDGRPSS